LTDKNSFTVKFAYFYKSNFINIKETLGEFVDECRDLIVSLLEVAACLYRGIMFLASLVLYILFVFVPVLQVIKCRLVVWVNEKDAQRIAGRPAGYYTRKSVEKMNETVKARALGNAGIEGGNSEGKI